MEESNVGVTEYSGGNFDSCRFPYTFNFAKCRIRFTNDMLKHYFPGSGLIKSKKLIIYDLTDEQETHRKSLKRYQTKTGGSFIVSYRSLFKVINDEIIPVIIIDHNQNIHIQCDILVDRFGASLLKEVVSLHAGEVTLHTNLAGEFFIHPDKKFNSLKEKREVERVFTETLCLISEIKFKSLSS